jgi:hypothetical protein
MWNYTWTFEDTTLSQAIDRIGDNREWGNHYSFKVRNDRKFEQLVFRKVIDRVDLLREIRLNPILFNNKNRQYAAPGNREQAPGS